MRVLNTYVFRRMRRICAGRISSRMRNSGVSMRDGMPPMRGLRVSTAADEIDRSVVNPLFAFAGRRRSRDRKTSARCVANARVRIDCGLRNFRSHSFGATHVARFFGDCNVDKNKRQPSADASRHQLGAITDTVFRRYARTRRAPRKYTCPNNDCCAELRTAAAASDRFQSWFR